MPGSTDLPADLHYSDDSEPGVSRRRAGRGFSYRDSDGKTIRDTRELKRIRSLAVPPAYQKVWICASPGGHLQATGFDARGRKQYRYHPRFREVRDAAKFGRMLDFGTALEAGRIRIETDLRRPGLPRAKVLALMATLLDRALIRVGNDSYAKANGSFGLTTLLDDHVVPLRGRLLLRFRGKSGIDRELTLTDRRLRQLVLRCQDLPGQRLFQYIDADGEQRPVTSTDVNAYLAETLHMAATAKEFRTWGATVMAVSSLARTPRPDAESARRQLIARAIEAVAEKLGNTPAVCRSSYVHPFVIECFEKDSLASLAKLELDGERLDWRDAEAATMRVLAAAKPVKPDHKGSRKPK